MAITTLNDLTTKIRPPVFFSKNGSGTPSSAMGTFWAGLQEPVAGVYDTTLNGVALTAPVTGGLNFTNSVGGGSNTYLSKFTLASSIIGSFMLCDRLWHNGGITITSTSAQTITSPAFPSRDADGTSVDRGVLLAVEVSATTGAGTPTITISYTNQAGTAGRTATNVRATVASSTGGSVYLMSLEGQDQGVQSVQSITLSATWTSGTINIVAYRLIAQIDIDMAGKRNMIDAIQMGFPQLYDGSVLYFMFFGASNPVIQGNIVYAQG